jgi:hypothetical protein
MTKVDPHFNDLMDKYELNESDFMQLIITEVIINKGQYQCIEKLEFESRSSKVDGVVVIDISANNSTVLLIKYIIEYVAKVGEVLVKVNY